MTVRPPVAVADSFVQLTVIETPWLSAADGSHVFVKDSDAGVGDFVTSQTCVVSWAADMSLLSSCGAISFGSIETALVPMTDVLPVRLSARLACSDEPG